MQDEPLLGVLAGSCMNNNGMSATLGAPSAAADQELLYLALRNSGIAPNDIELIEAHGDGIYLSDAIETAAFMRALRSDEGASENMLMVGAVKSHYGHSNHSAGAVG